jgi:phage shock protein E
VTVSPDVVPWVVVIGVFGALQVFKRLGQVSSARARELVASGAKLVDVRTPAEFSMGHVPGAVNVPLGELKERADALGAKDKPLVLYCASGTRSAMARSLLKGRGFTQVFNLGSMSRW